MDPIVAEKISRETSMGFRTEEEVLGGWSFDDMMLVMLLFTRTYS